jgi:hypothetical protein
MVLFIDDISLLYPKDPIKAAINVKATVSERHKVSTLGPGRQFFGIEIHCEQNRTSMKLGQMAFVTTILKRFNIQNDHAVSTLMDPNVMLDLAEDLGEKELNNIKDYQAIIGSVMYAVLATLPDMSSLCHLSKPNTSPALRPPVNRNGCSSSTKIYTAQTHPRSKSIGTIQVH